MKRPLDEVRSAIRGWSFADDKGLCARISEGEKAVVNLPEYLREQGNQMLDELRNSLLELRNKK